MTEAARELLVTFDALSPVDQEQVAAEILLRATHPMTCRRTLCTS